MFTWILVFGNILKGDESSYGRQCIFTFSKLIIYVFSDQGGLESQMVWSCHIKVTRMIVGNFEKNP